MDDKSLAAYLFHTKPILFIRRYIPYMCILLFFALNYGHSFRALKSAFSIFFYRQWGAKIPDDSSIAQSQEYYDLFSVDTMNIFAETIMNTSFAGVAAIFFIWGFDLIGDHRSNMSRETAQMRRRIRLEIKNLDDKGRLLPTLHHEQRLNDKFQEVVTKLEAIILRYERNASIINPDITKVMTHSAHEAQTDETIVDLFSKRDDQRGEKPEKQTQPKNVIFKPKL